jgi:OmpA-OmpF porin, OOP family
MKTAAIILGFIFVSNLISAQSGILERQKENAKNKVNSRIENKIDQKIDKTLDKVEDKMSGNNDSEQKTKKGSTEKKSKNETDVTVNETATTQNSTENSSQNSTKSNSKEEDKSFKSYSKFDFVPGEKVIMLDDYAQDEIGDFPVNWNTNGSGEVVTIRNKEGKWLKLSGEGIFYPDNLGVLPENVTIEFEIGTSIENEVLTNFSFLDSKRFPNLLNYGLENAVEVSLNAFGHFKVMCRDNENNYKLENTKTQNQYILPDKNFVNISIWKQGTRFRMYLNEEKVLDLPRAFEKNVEYRFVMSTTTNYLENREAYIGPIRVASGIPDTRSKLISEGKLSTTGIKFDSGSDKIKPESYGTLQTIATVLKENPDVKIKIIGHTDSDGDAQKNLELSKKRAAAVKNSLNKEFNISLDRIETDGKGQTESVEPNTSPEGKANNRRVEFIKL